MWQHGPFQYGPESVRARPTLPYSQMPMTSEFIGRGIESKLDRKRATNGVAITCMATDKRGNVYIVRSMEFGDLFLHDKPELMNQTSCIELYSQTDLTKLVAKRQFRTSDREQLCNLVLSASGDLYFNVAKWTGVDPGNHATTMCHLPPFKELVTIGMLDDACSNRLNINCLGIVQQYLCGVEFKYSIPVIDAAVMHPAWLQPLSKDIYCIKGLIMDNTRRYLYAHVNEVVSDEWVTCIRYWDTMYTREQANVLPLESSSPQSSSSPGESSLSSPDTVTNSSMLIQSGQVSSMQLDLDKEVSVGKHGKYVFGHESPRLGVYANCIDVQQHGTCLYFIYNLLSSDKTNVRFASRNNKPGSTIDSTILLQDVYMHYTEVGGDGWRCFVGKYIWLWNSKTDQVRIFDSTWFSRENYRGYACFADDGKRIIASTNDREHVRILTVDDSTVYDSTAYAHVPDDMKATTALANLQTTPLKTAHYPSKQVQLVSSTETKVEPTTPKILDKAETKTNEVKASGKILGTCANCRELTATKRCGGCHVTIYCNAACQKEDWKNHKSKCR